MAAEEPPPPEILRLNAFVDGELTATERAAVAAQIRAHPEFAQAHAALARLKACIGESADATAAPAVATRAKRPSRTFLAVGVAALGLCLVVAGVLTLPEPFAERNAVPLLGRDAVVTLAALPGNPVIPRLDVGGLSLEDVKIDRAGDVRLLVASYRGPHGCRLDLRVSPAGSTVPAAVGSSRHTWGVGPLAYELVAHGMPGWRFAVIADAAERETRGGRASDAIRRRLREARIAAPPCAG